MDRIVKTPELTEMGFGSRTTIYRKVKSGDFPPPVILTPKGKQARIGWRLSEIEAYVAALPRRVSGGPESAPAPLAASSASERE